MKILHKKIRGYTLIIVLWAIVIISLTLTSLIDEVHLNNLILRYNLDERQFNQVATAGIIKGINQLLIDETTYDTKFDLWYKELKEETQEFTSTIKIEDIGSRLNINFAPFKIIEELDFWEEELTEELKELDLIPNLIFLKEFLGEDYKSGKEVLTTQGLFNIYYSPLSSLAKLLELVGTDEQHIELILKDWQEFRKTNINIELLEELAVLIESLDLLTFNKIEPYLTHKASMNINFVPEKVLKATLTGLWELEKLKINDYLAELISLRQTEGIEEFNQLLNIFPINKYNQLEKYFTTSSYYFIITSTVVSNTGQTKEIRAVVERFKIDNDKWQIKIVEWLEEV